MFRFQASILILLLSVLLFACQQQEKKVVKLNKAVTDQEIDDASPLLEINLAHAKEEGLLANAEVITVAYDRVFKRTKKYEAIPLKPYLEKLITTQNLDTSNTEIIFLCKDGYNPSLSLSKVMKDEPYLAIKDLEATEGNNWMDTLKGKWSPFYLVWPNHLVETKGYAWPYGLKYLQFKASDEAYKAAMPIDKKQLAGFELYKKNCMKCHSVNKVGGVMGPEFNIPKNITEYWQTKDIKAFVKNPYSYRYNSKMPPVTNLKDEELDVLINYLVYMKAYKISIE